MVRTGAGRRGRPAGWDRLRMSGNLERRLSKLEEATGRPDLPGLVFMTAEEFTRRKAEGSLPSHRCLIWIEPEVRT
jgi:hypothetical protein